MQAKQNDLIEATNKNDLIEAADHMLRVDHIIDTATQALTQTYIKRLHYQLFYGTFDERRGKCRIGVYRAKANNLEKMKAPAAKDINSQLSKLIGKYSFAFSSLSLKGLLKLYESSSEVE